MKKLSCHVIPLVALSASCLGATPTAEREASLRFPESVVKRNAYNANVDPDYRHASPAAYDNFKAMKYGVRIHWGLYSMLPAAQESWTFLGLNNAERQQYLESYRQWNPQGFDAEKWMQFFDQAGFRCFAITTKHHEGFSLWDTKTRVMRRPNYTGPNGPTIEPCNLAYSVMDTPFKRDIIKELTDAAHRHDIKVNLYFSHSDWYDADLRPYGRHPLQYAGSNQIDGLQQKQKRPVQLVAPPTAEERARGLARHRAQLRELLTNYGKVDMVCLDISLGDDDWPQLRGTLQQLRQLQPDVMFRNRGIGNYGDYYTPERVVPGDTSGNSMPWMVIYPLGTHFSWEGDAAKHKGAKWVVDNLVDSVAKGGNFMVGIGPNANGEFHPAAIAQLQEVGAWLMVNGEGIFDTHQRAGDGWKDGEFIRYTESNDGRYVYAHLLHRPEGKVVLHNFTARPDVEVKLLGRPEALNWRTNGDSVVIDFPSSAPSALAYTLRVRLQ